MSDETSSDAQANYGEILAAEIDSGLRELERPAKGLLLSALSAGLDVGFSLLMMAALSHHLEGSVSPGVQHVLVANMYAVGFLFVVIGRSELFTEHTTHAVLPVLDGKASLAQLARLWLFVFVANQAGAALFATGVGLLGPRLGVAPVPVLARIAHELTDHPSPVILASGVLAGWMMGLLSWLVKAVKDTTAMMLVVWMITAGIGLAGLHHCVVGTTEILAAVVAGSDVSVFEWLRFLLWATIGNVIGGVVFVALIKYSHATRS